MTFNFLGPGLTVNVEAKVKEQIILDSSGSTLSFCGNVLSHFSKLFMFVFSSAARAGPVIARAETAAAPMMKDLLSIF